MCVSGHVDTRKARVPKDKPCWGGRQGRLFLLWLFAGVIHEGFVVESGGR